VISIRAVLTVLCWLLLIGLTIFVIIIGNIGLIAGIILFWAILITDITRTVYDKSRMNQDDPGD